MTKTILEVDLANNVNMHEPVFPVSSNKSHGQLVPFVNLHS